MKCAGVEVHAQAFETMARGRFLTPAPDHAMLGALRAVCSAAGVIFALLPGWQAYALGAIGW